MRLPRGLGTPPHIHRLTRPCGGRTEETHMNLAIITGASSGLGREYARIVAEKYPQLD